jgi:hypothetical protein
MIDKNVTLNLENQIVLLENELTAPESSLLVLAIDPVLPENELTTPEISLLVPAIYHVPLGLISEIARVQLSESQTQDENVFQLSRCTVAQKSIYNYIISMKVEQDVY